MQLTEKVLQKAGIVCTSAQLKLNLIKQQNLLHVTFNPAFCNTVLCAVFLHKYFKMELIKNYQNALQAIYDHVGFKEDWVIAPIDDCTDKFWNTDGETVHYADSEEEFKAEEGNFYSDDVYKLRFYDKWIYEGKDFTMIFCDPHVDGMKWFRIFDNTKRLF